MTHDELLARIVKLSVTPENNVVPSELATALMSVVELHKPMWDNEYCAECHPEHNGSYPCPTIQAIDKELT